MSYFTPTHVAARAKAEGEARRAQDRAMRGIPEARQLSRDTLATLADAGRLPITSLRAGREIAQLAYAQTACVRGRTTAAYFERLAPGASTGYSDHVEIAFRERWSPWQRWAGGPWAPGSAPQVVGAARMTLLVFTVLVAADNLNLRAVSRAARCDHRSALPALQRSLAWYAEQAGWCVDHPMRESVDAHPVSGHKDVNLVDVRPAA
jgi:hypothetical protein